MSKCFSQLLNFLRLSRWDISKAPGCQTLPVMFPVLFDSPLVRAVLVFASGPSVRPQAQRSRIVGVISPASVAGVAKVP